MPTASARFRVWCLINDAALILYVVAEDEA